MIDSSWIGRHLMSSSWFLQCRMDRSYMCIQLYGINQVPCGILLTFGRMVIEVTSSGRRSCKSS